MFELPEYRPSREALGPTVILFLAGLSGLYLIFFDGKRLRSLASAVAALS